MTPTSSANEPPSQSGDTSRALWARVAKLNQRINWITLFTAAQVVILGIQLILMERQTKLAGDQNALQQQQTALMATQTGTANKVLELENEVSVNVTYNLERRVLLASNYSATAIFIHGYQYGEAVPVYLEAPAMALRETGIDLSAQGFEEAAKNGKITGSKGEIRYAPCAVFIKNRLGRKFRIGFNGTATFDSAKMEWKIGAITYEIKEFDW